MHDPTANDLALEHDADLHKARPRFGCPKCIAAAHPSEPPMTTISLNDLANMRRLLELAASGVQECVDMFDEITEGK